MTVTLEDTVGELREQGKIGGGGSDVLESTRTMADAE
jgi:hypothetical protein